MKNEKFEFFNLKWDQYWFGPVAAIRPYLLIKAVLLIIGLDSLVLQIRRGTGYGGFNVAHLRWLDFIQPVPTSSFYAGLMFAFGILALFSVFAGLGRWARALLALMWTYGWSMSMLDGYQHHYLLSLILAPFAFFPNLKAAELFEAEKAERSKVGSWAYALLGVNMAVVYAFTAFAKLDPEWRMGGVIRRSPALGGAFRPLEPWAGQLGISPDLYWAIVGHSVIALELFVPLGYLLAVKLDDQPKRWLRIVTWLSFLTAMGFHLNNELLVRLRIGWFSYYMIAIACVYFLPESWLWWTAKLLTWPGRRLGRAWSNLAAGSATRRWVAMGLTAMAVGAAVALIAMLGISLGLPGSKLVGLCAAVAVAGASLVALLLGRIRVAGRYALATALTVFLVWPAIRYRLVGFDYYLGYGRYMRFQGNFEAAAEAYKKAATYLPKYGRLPTVREEPDKPDGDDLPPFE